MRFRRVADSAGRLVERGAALKIDIGFDRTWKPDRNAPPKANKTGIIALIDTGAEQSFIDTELASASALPLYDERDVIGIFGPQPAKWYLAQVHFPALRLTVRGEFAALPLIKGGIGYHALIGRTFLRYVRMEYNGVTGSVGVFQD